MTTATDYIDEHQGLANLRIGWETHWREISAYVLPQVDTFSSMFGGNGHAAINGVVSTPVSARRSKDLYDMTSLWGIDRLAAGLLSLKTPESQLWHGLGTDDMFGEEMSYEEKVATERLNKYLFKVRSNPKSGFWNAHRPAIKSMCAFGTGWIMILEKEGRDARTPYEYTYIPITELYAGTATNGQVNRGYRAFAWTFEQIVRHFGADNVPKQFVVYANDKEQKHKTAKILHCVRPRSDPGREPGTKGSEFVSQYVLPDESALVGPESGFFEFPFVRYSWSNNGLSPYSEGPISFAIGELRSLQEMAKNEVIASQLAVRPAYGVAGKNFVKLNLNPGMAIPGMVTPDGKPLFQAFNGGNRPDFAMEVIRTRRESIREMLYLNLWNILLDPSNEKTATEAMIRAQEKGEMLGPVGISMSEGLSTMVDREIGILGRKRAFDDESPLAMPESMANRDVSPTFTSPLDRLRRMGELVGMQQLIQFVGLLAQAKPDIVERLDPDEMLETAQEILGAPVKSLRDREAAAPARDQLANMQQTMGMLATLKGAGDAAKSVGDGAQAAAAGADMTDQSSALSGILGRTPQVLDQADAAMAAA